jgi:sialate O-acetylesterase
MMRWPLLLIALLLVVCHECRAASSPAGERLARIFTDHLVLQRDQVVPIWGWATPGQVIRVAFAGQDVTTTTDANGCWRAQLAPLRLSSTPAELVVTGSTTLRLRDVLVGDVWLCSGQSNMGFPLDACDAAEDIRTADFPLIRYTRCGEHFSARLQDDVVSAAWKAMTPETARACGAVPFFFARRIHAETRVPIGLLHCEIGGTDIECWMPPAAFREYPANAEVARRLDEAIARYQQAIPVALAQVEAWLPQAKQAVRDNQPLPPAPRLPVHPNEDRGPGGEWVRTQSLYNGMVHPIVGYALTGAIWYQGENNGQEQHSYVEKKRALIETWRKLWGRDFPFYYVQLANWRPATNDPSGGNREWQYGRMAQLQCLSIPKTGMAVAIDIGDADDIHPRNKFDVGERLALWALAKDYGKTDLVYSGPLYAGTTVEGSRIRVRFTSVGAGLMVGDKVGRSPVKEQSGGKLARFAIAGADKKWFWADAAIDGDTVVVSSPQVTTPVAVRYAFAQNPAGCNLYNRAGLPASPFRTDDW